MSNVSLHADSGLQSVLTPATKNTAPVDSNMTGAVVDSSVGADFARSVSSVNAANTAENAEQQDPQESLDQVADDLTQTMSMMKKGLEFKVDEQDGQPVVSVVDVDSGELIRQIPSEEALKLAEKMSEVAGFLMKTEA